MGLFETHTKDQCDIKSCIPINRHIGHLEIDPFIKMAEDQFFVCMLGRNLYEFLCKGFNNGGRDGYEKGSDDRKIFDLLIDKARCAVAWYAYHKMLPHLNVQTSSSGVVQNQNEKVVAAPKWAFDSVYWDACRNAWDEMEALIWKCICPNQNEILEFQGILWLNGFLEKDSISCCEFFLYSPTVFAAHQRLQSHGKFETWMSLIPYMRQAEKHFLLPILCPEFFAELKAKMCACTLSEKEKELVQCIREYLSEITLKLAAPKFNITYGKGGARVVERVEGQTKNTKPSWNDQEFFYQSIQQATSKSYKTIVKCLENNREDFPTWANSECGQVSEEPCASNKPKTCGCDCACDCDSNSGSVTAADSIVFI